MLHPLLIITAVGVFTAAFFCCCSNFSVFVIGAARLYLCLCLCLLVPLLVLVLVPLLVLVLVPLLACASTCAFPGLCLCLVVPLQQLACASESAAAADLPWEQQPSRNSCSHKHYDGGGDVEGGDDVDVGDDDDDDDEQTTGAAQQPNHNSFSHKHHLCSD